MNETVARLRDRFYCDAIHPNRRLELAVHEILRVGEDVLLDAGCGRSAPVLKKFLGRAKHLIGVELVDFRDVPEGIETHQCDLANIPVADASVDIIMSRSVFEHLTDPQSVYRELSRVLRPGGKLVFLTANMWDYGTLIARLVPNRLHGRVVKAVEGRAEEDTFPTAYKTNTRKDVERLARDAGLSIKRFEYLSQYPNYLQFNAAAFMVGVGYEKLVSKVEFLRFLRGWILVTLEKPAAAAAR